MLTHVASGDENASLLDDRRRARCSGRTSDRGAVLLERAQRVV